MDGAVKKTCVIADDVRVSRELMRSWLEDCGYECVLASDGEAAWQSVLELQPQLVITDIEMPKLSGLDLLYSLRHHAVAELRSLPVIVISSLRDCELDKIVQSFGGTCLLTKPLEKMPMKKAVEFVEADPHREDTFVVDDWIRTSGGDAGAVSPKLRRLVNEAFDRGPM